MKIIKKIIKLILAFSLFLPFPIYALDLNYNDIPIRQALQFIAEASHQNIIISDKVKGDITLHLQNVSPANALNTILQEAGLGQQMRGNTLIVAPLQELAQHEKIQEELQNLGALQSIFIPLHYAKSSDILNTLKNNHLLSPRGDISIDTRTNTVWIEDTPAKIIAVQQFIRKIDIPVDQIFIHANIISVDKSHEQELGVKFGAQKSAGITDGKFKLDLPAANPHAATTGILLSTFGNNTALNLELSALENEGYAKIISSPQLITANQQPATILAGQEIPYQQSTLGGGTSVSFQKAVISLTVTPQITPNKKFILKLVINQDRPSGTAVRGEPIIETRQIQTTVTLAEGQTIILGGIYEKNNENRTASVPVLGKIPLIGVLFRHTVTQQSTRELLIFITPALASG